MNNILKVLIGVLALSGFIIMLMPQGDPLAKPTDAETEIPVIEPTTLPTVAPIPAQNNNENQTFDVREEDYSNFGKPMMNPAPLGGETATQDPDNEAQPAPLPYSPPAAPNAGITTAPNPNAALAPGPLPVIE